MFQSRYRGAHGYVGKGGHRIGVSHTSNHHGSTIAQKHNQAKSSKCGYGKGLHHSIPKGKSHGPKGWHVHKEFLKHDHGSAGCHGKGKGGSSHRRHDHGSTGSLGKGNGGSAHRRHIQHVRDDSQRITHDRHSRCARHRSMGSQHDNNESRQRTNKLYNTKNTRTEAKVSKRLKRISKLEAGSPGCNVHDIGEQKHIKRHSIVNHSMAGRLFHVRRKTFEKSCSAHHIHHGKIVIKSALTLGAHCREFNTALPGKSQQAIAMKSGARAQLKLLPKPTQHSRPKNVESEQPKHLRRGLAASVAKRLKPKKRSRKHAQRASTVITKRAGSPRQYLVKPSQVRFSQNSIGDTFRDGNSLKDTQRAIASGTMRKRAIPPIRVFRTRKGNLVSHDNRRLAMYQKLEMNRQVGKIKVELTKQRVPKWKLSTLNRGIAVRLRKNRKSMSVAGSSSSTNASTSPPSTMVMFHGTSPESAALIMKEGFRPSSGGMLGPGVYLSRDMAKAKRYGDAVLEVSADLGCVKRIDWQGHEMQKTWSTHGYDSAWCPPNCGMVASGLEEDCVRDPSHVKVIRRVI